MAITIMDTSPRFTTWRSSAGTTSLSHLPMFHVAHTMPKSSSRRTSSRTATSTRCLFANHATNPRLSFYTVETKCLAIPELFQADLAAASHQLQRDGVCGHREKGHDGRFARRHRRCRSPGGARARLCRRREVADPGAVAVRRPQGTVHGPLNFQGAGLRSNCCRHRERHDALRRICSAGSRSRSSTAPTPRPAGSRSTRQFRCEDT